MNKNPIMKISTIKNNNNKNLFNTKIPIKKIIKIILNNKIIKNNKTLKN